MSLLISKKTYLVYVRNKNGLSRSLSGKIYYRYILRTRHTKCVASIFVLFSVKGKGKGTFNTTVWINTVFLKPVSAEFYNFYP
jgi:hypothetical protein